MVKRKRPSPISRVYFQPMPSLPVISLITPCPEVGPALDRTLLSVFAQAGNFRIRHRVCVYGDGTGVAERLAWWREQLDSGGFPIQCDRISLEIDPDPAAGRIAALCRGMAAQKPAPDGFTGWLEPGDRLLPGALALVADAGERFTPAQLSWLVGAACDSPPDRPPQSEDPPLPRAALQAGLCDGVHWPRLPSAGSFFRGWLWTRADPEATLSALEHSGDWALWRLLAGTATPVQTRIALAAATAEDGAAENALAEIDVALPRAARRAALQALDPAPTRRVLETGTKDEMSIAEESCAALRAAVQAQVLGEAPDTLPDQTPARLLHRAGPPLHQAFRPLSEVIARHGNVVAYDAEWQYPAITERHAFRKLGELGAVPDGVTYVAYPWATLIDKLQRKTPDSELCLERFRAFCRQLPAGTLRLTTCQHIRMKEMMHLFREAGISHIFWSHATHADIAAVGAGGIALHPFPLFPVQIQDPLPPEDAGDRPHLFSFVGARANRFYLTQSRNLILDLLADHPGGLIVGRDGWHYNKVVYELQVHRSGTLVAGAADLIDRTASDEFRATLRQSLFSLCPSGTGPNSIRLWESLGAGAIPVILADSYAPPGDPALWQAAAVFCDETPEAIRALPARLEEIAADPARLAAMRQAGRQLWLLYGPHCFVYDIQTFLLDAPALSAVAEPGNAGGFLTLLTGDLSARDDLAETEAVLWLQGAASALLLGGDEAFSDPARDSLLTRIRGFLTDRHPALRQFDAARDLVRHRATAAPAVSTDARLQVCLFGKHSNRTPLGYPVFQALAADQVRFTDDPARADLILTGFNADLRDNADSLDRALRQSPATRLVVLSEEPLWDSIWSGGFTARDRVFEAGPVRLPYTFLNHANSGIFDFDRIPYFLLTHENFQARYGLFIARHADLTPRALLDHWQDARVPAAFYAEYRDNPAYDASFPEDAVIGLSVYRTKVAQALDLPGVLRVGRNWSPEAAPRQALPDWHLDKLAALDMRVRVLGSYENTHQRAYVSEKIFDAFVTGAIPTYFAGPGHRVFDLVPEAAMLNTYGQSPEAAAARIAGFSPDIAFAEAWLDTARALHVRFTDLDAIARERRRVTGAVLDALEQCRARDHAA